MDRAKAPLQGAMPKMGCTSTLMRLKKSGDVQI
jgi:hypothetical protein